MSERTITLALRRPYTLVDWEESGPVDGSTLPVGTPITVTICDEALMADVQYPITPNLVGCPFSDAGLLHAAAEEPCPHLMEQSCDCGGEYPCSHGDWFGCRIADDERIPTCLGDKCKCPLSTSQQEGRERTCE